jgi:hypothetical protein
VSYGVLQLENPPKLGCLAFSACIDAIIEDAPGLGGVPHLLLQREGAEMTAIASLQALTASRA